MRFAGTCVGEKSLQPPRPNCHIRGTKSLDEYAQVCNHTRSIVVYRTCNHCPTIHQNCEVNQVVAAANRVIGALASDGVSQMPLMTMNGSSRQLATLRMMAKSILGMQDLSSMERLSEYWFTNCYTGRKLSMYWEAHREMCTWGINSRHARVEAHIKAERWFPSQKENPDPRVIQARTRVYNLCLGRYTKVVEHALYEWQPKFVRSGTRVVAKGLNPWQRATLARQKWDCFTKPVVLSFDASRFDKHVGLEQLRLEHRFYLMLFANDGFLRELLRGQENNEVRFLRSSVKYVCEGGRMSGDMNTALGNCVIMISMLVAFMRMLNIREFDILDDGDDVLLFIEQQCVDRVLRKAPAFFESMGHEIKVDGQAHEFEEIVFCQAHPILTSKGWNFVRNPWKVINSFYTGWKDMFQHPDRMLKTKAQAELWLNAGVPVVQELAATLIEQCSDAKLLPHASLTHRIHGEGRSWMEEVRQPVVDAARVGFDRAFGIGVDLQRALEQWFRDNPVYFGDVIKTEPLYDKGRHGTVPLPAPPWAPFAIG